MAVCPNCHETNPEAGARCVRCEGFHYVPEEAVEDAASDKLIGRMAAEKYVILSLINEGGMGAVYRALQLPVEREVAFKVLRTELKDSDNGRDRFIREARAVSRLNHPNIITLYDFGFDNGKHPYMVMEYAPGKSLAKWLKTEAVTTERILRVTAQILSALTEAHTHGIVHRDLKPENMIISPRASEADRVKLLDFGIARMINEGATRGITREGEVFGTPHYMAPEQAQGRKDIGPPADVYAVGVMLWEMLCGDSPFDAPTPLAVLFMHINDPVPPLQPRAGVELVPGLEAVVQRAMAKEPRDRYQTASEMMADIGQIFSSMTGAHPAMLHAETSQEFSPGETFRPGAPPAGFATSPTMQTPVPGRQPYFTPMTTDVGVGVSVADPDPSYATRMPAEVLAEVERASQSVDDEPPAPKSRGGLIVAVVVFLIIGAGVALLALSGPSDADADATVPPVAVEEPVKPPRDVPAEIVVEPIEEPVEAVAAAPADAGVADAGAPAAVAKVEPEPQPQPQPRTTPARTTTKPKVEPKPTVEPKPKSETKPASDKPDTRSNKPVRFDKLPSDTPKRDDRIFAPVGN